MMDQFNLNNQYLKKKVTLDTVAQEIEKGLILINGISQKIVTFFGTHAIDVNHSDYKHCFVTAQELGKRDFAILTGGGPGIMHAANSGAKSANAISIGLKAKLLSKEQVEDPIYTATICFKFIFVRRFIMSIKSSALIFYPGGYGTLNELFEYLVLMQTHIVDKVPIICVHKEYWKGLFAWMKEHTHKEGYIQEKDLELISFAETTEEIVKIVECNS